MCKTSFTEIRLLFQEYGESLLPVAARLPSHISYDQPTIANTAAWYGGESARPISRVLSKETQHWQVEPGSTELCTCIGRCIVCCIYAQGAALLNGLASSSKLAACARRLRETLALGIFPRLHAPPTTGGREKEAWFQQRRLSAIPGAITCGRERTVKRDKDSPSFALSADMPCESWWRA